jgi:GH24 family phage-related lysozyme (muramidase)
MEECIMSPNGRKLLQKMLMRQEGLKLNLNTDPRGYYEIGFGHCLSKKPISLSAAIFILNDDTLDAIREINTHLPWYTDLNEARQSALISMCFNEGIGGLLGFNAMLDALQSSDWQKAHDECLNSLAAEEDKDRYTELSQIFLTGELT